MKRFTALFLFLILSFSVCVLAETVSVKDDDQFEDVLGIDIDAEDISRFADHTDMLLIDNRIGEIVFTLPDIDGNLLDWTLRFTKDSTVSESLALFAGIDDSALSEPTVRDIPYQEDSDDSEITVFLTSMTAGDTDVYLWNVRKASFVLTVSGSYSQMQFAEIMDRVFDACLDD